MASSSKPLAFYRRTEWTLPRERVLVQILLDLKRSGKWCDTGPRRESWGVIEDQMNKKFSTLPTTRTQIKNHLFELKKSYFVVKAIRESSGFEWDDSRQQARASESTWEEYIMAHKEAKRFRMNSFPLYDELDELYRGTGFKGRNSISTMPVNQKEDIVPHIPSHPLLVDDMNKRSDSSNSADVNQIESESTPIPPRENQEDFDRDKRRSGTTTSSVPTKRSRTSIGVLADELSRLVDVRSAASKPSSTPNPHGYDACMDEIISMEEFTIEERIKLSDLLRDELYRIAFMKFSGVQRIAWVRAKLLEQ